MITLFCVDNYKSLSNWSMNLVNSRKYPTTANTRNIFFYNNTPVLKSAALYGANGSGKTNFLEAIYTLQQIVLDNMSISDIDQNRFSKTNQTTFSIIFIYKQKVTYKYQLFTSKKEISGEKLSIVGTKRESNVFIRVFDKLKLNPKFVKGKRKALEKTEVPNKPFLLNLAGSGNCEDAENVISWFKNDLCFIPFNTACINDTAIKMHYSVDFEHRVRHFMEALIQINVKLYYKNSNEIVIKSVYDIGNNHKAELDFIEDESSGAHIIFSLLYPILTAVFEENKVFLMNDPFANLHPLLAEKILEIMHMTKGQFLFSTHQSHLLKGNELRQQQIYFCEKTKFYPMSELKERKDIQKQKAYLEGKFGAVPNLS